MEEHAQGEISSTEFRLLKGERILSVEKFPARIFTNAPSSLQQILRLTNSIDSSRIGENGPSVASLAFDSEALVSTDAVAPGHLRLYEVLFGRDSLRVAIDLISSYPELARATVLELARLQGVVRDDTREEEPGRIVHEARSPNDLIAIELSSRLGWGWPYYGSVDATPEFIRTLTAYIRRTEENHGFLSEHYIDRSGTERTIAYALDMALHWITTRLDSSPDYLLEYKSTLPRGLENQVWKDSWDAYHHKDGSIANHDGGVAAFDAQVTTYDALLDAAYIYDMVLDDERKSRELHQRAMKLGKRILDVFWTDDEDGYFVLGLDRDTSGTLQQMKVKTSSMGHALNSRLLEENTTENKKKREQVMAHLLSPKLLNVSGIRTLASDETRFRPGAYHCGSVWLWDTHHIAKGMRRLGYSEQADDLDRRLLKVVDATKIFPEYVRGDDSATPSINTHRITLWDTINERENVVEQPPQEVQAWSVAAILAIKKRLDRKRASLQSQ
jgi:glycogen debranching enzyme